jgi:hypothetical protein
MTAGDDIRAEPSGLPPGRTVVAARPLLVTTSPLTAGTGLILQRGHLAGLQPARRHRAGPRRGQRPGLRERGHAGARALVLLVEAL